MATVAAPVVAVAAPALSTEEELRAQDYYDSEDAFNFYHEVWGGENIHVGIYDGIAENSQVIREAGEASLSKLFEVRPPAKGARIMDMGSAYGGCARHAHAKFGAKVSCVDLSAKENSKNAERNKAAGIPEDEIWIAGERSFTATGEPEDSFDLIVSQDSFLHAGQYRAGSIAEAARVLKPGGYLVFTDIMQSDTCDLSQMKPVYDRIGLDDMGSPQKYKEWGAAAGLEWEEFVDHSDQLHNHYTSVRKVLLAKHADKSLEGKVSAGFVGRMEKGLITWIEQANNKNLAWGYNIFCKPSN
jgi:sarcosine/dimethylglycine N-methyltransferase